MKKRMRQLTTVNSTLVIKYTCTVCTCVMRRYMYGSGTSISHMYAVYSTQHWIILPVVVQEHVVINMES